MKEQIANALKTKYRSFGLSNEALDRIASAKEKTVTDESTIDEAISDAETMSLIAKELQKMRDAEIQKRTDTQRAFDTYKESHPDKDPEPPTPPTPPTPPKSDTETEPEWARKLRERYEREDKEKQEKQMRDSITARLKMEGCSNTGIIKFIMAGYTPIKDESEDDAVKRLKESYSSTYKETFGEGPIPGFGISIPAEKSAADKAAQAREDAKRVRE